MRRVASGILLLEPVLLGVMISAFWFDNPVRVYSLLLLIPPMLARLILYRRLWVNVALSVPLLLFLLLCAVNTFVALRDPVAPPYSWGWYMIGRPVMGIAFALSLTSLIAERGRIDGALLAAMVLALLVGVLGLTSAQYNEVKSAQLEFVIRLLPQIRDFPGAVGGFNVNEIGGAMAFFAPLTAGIVLYELRQSRRAELRLLAAGLAFALLALALFLGQSRFAIFGVVLALGLLILLLIPNRRWRWISLALLLAFCALEVGIVTDIFERSSSTPTPVLNERDESSITQRAVIWGAALDIIRDYPLTGVGLNQFRSRQVREAYPVPDFAMTVVPHAHNELLQVGADAGIPGMILFGFWHVVIVGMVWRVWRSSSLLLRVVALSAAAGLLAHAVFGLADAITLFDRFIWAYWLLVGLVGGAYALARRAEPLAPITAPAESSVTMNA